MNTETKTVPNDVPDSAPDGTTPHGAEQPQSKGRREGPDRPAIAVAGAVFAACVGLVLYGVLDSEEKPQPRAVPTAEVTYEVLGKGTADISYQARSEKGRAVTVTGAELPWRKTVRVPLGKEPIVSLMLGEKGGEASCTLAIRGKHVQRSTAFGTYGRTSCTGSLPAPGTDVSSSDGVE